MRFANRRSFFFVPFGMQPTIAHYATAQAAQDTDDTHFHRKCNGCGRDTIVVVEVVVNPALFVDPVGCEIHRIYHSRHWQTTHAYYMRNAGFAAS